MAQKTQEKGVTGPAPVVDAPGKVRNVVLVGHSGAGKTTLVEALLAATGTISRAGTVTDGTTVSDHDPAAVRQQRSVEPGLRPARCTTASRSTCSTPPATPTSSASCGPACAPPTPPSSSSPRSTAWTPPRPRCGRSAPRVGMPRAVAIARLDHPRADFDETLALCQEAFGDGVLPLYLPMLGDDGESVGRPDRA